MNQIDQTNRTDQNRLRLSQTCRPSKSCSAERVFSQPADTSVRQTIDGSDREINDIRIREIKARRDARKVSSRFDEIGTITEGARLDE